MGLISDPIFKGLKHIVHGHSTRVEGLIQAYDELKAGEATLQGVVSLKQVHGVEMVQVTQPGVQVAEADAVFTTQAGLVLSIQTADCVPLLVADRHKRFVAAAHAGWRGTVKQMAQILVTRLQKEFLAQSQDLVVSIGPCISLQSYEVGEEVYRAFDWDPERELYFSGSPKHLDLFEANRQQLLRAGIPAQNIGNLKLDTFADPKRFHSFRRDQNYAGRQFALLALI